MRGLALFLFERGCALLSSACAFIGLKMKKRASVGELQSDGSEKSGSAELLCMASLVLNFLDLIYLCVDHTSIILNNTHSLLVNKNKANSFNTSLAWRIAADLLITVYSFLMSGFICISECMSSSAFYFRCGFKFYSDILNFLADLQVEK